ncbi:MAG: hypothetical protein KBS94_06810 [Prevotella sp.]|nr:hypothetical protein [Candidatus Equicola faecalis]
MERARATKAKAGTEKQDAIKVGSLRIYHNRTPEHYGVNSARKPAYSVTLGGKNLSGAYIPSTEFENPTCFIGWGDVKGTSDLIVFVFSAFEVIDGRVSDGAMLEMFIARDYAQHFRNVLDAVQDGCLDEEMNLLRGTAGAENV